MNSSTLQTIVISLARMYFRYILLRTSWSKVVGNIGPYTTCTYRVIDDTHASSIKEWFISKRRHFKIDEKKFLITTDNGSNMVSAFDYLMHLI